jgi:hypothetical protein
VDRSSNGSNLRYYLEICLQGPSKTTRSSVRIVSVLAEIQTGHLSSTTHNYCPLCQSAQYHRLKAGKYTNKWHFKNVKSIRMLSLSFSQQWLECDTMYSATSSLMFRNNVSPELKSKPRKQTERATHREASKRAQT